MDMLKMTKISKAFSGVTVLDKVNFTVKKGEVHALLGENGAGKSTLMNILAGVYTRDSGKVEFDGKPLENTTVKLSESAGIAFVHQELNLFNDLKVFENIFLRKEILTKLGTLNQKAMIAKTKELFASLGVDIDPNAMVSELETSKKQLLEIAKALFANAKLLILDEPTSSLNEEDSRALLDLLLRFKEEGMTCIIISHKLNEVSYVADEITVIRDGGTIETIDNAGHDIDEDRIIRGMVGREIEDRFPKRPDVKIGDVNMEVSDWTVHHPLYPERKVVDGVSMYVRKGEVVGISGLMGAGRTELAMSLFGRSYGTNISGKLTIGGKDVTLKNASAAIKAGLAYVTEDRKGNGLILSNPIRVNTTLANMKGVCDKGVIDYDKEVAVAEEYRQKLRTKCPSVEQNVGNLSGGNQQKVLLAKWMFTDPDILLLDEPTRGIDVGAKYEIYCIINDLVAQGKSVVMISSELPEILGMSDRIYVMNEGKFVGEFQQEDASQESIMACILKSTNK